MVDVVLQPPPRAVPWSVRLVVMLGGVLTQIGFGIAAFGLIFVFVFGSIAEPLFDDPFAGPLQHLTGKVVEVETTNVRINRSHVRAVHFEVTTGERPVRSVSYTRHQTPAVGDEVRVERARTPAAPMRIVGMSTHMAPAALHLVVLLPLVGACLALVGVWRNTRRLRLLRLGEVAQATLLERKATNTVVNGRRVQALTFGFVDGKGLQRRVTARTHQPEHVTDEPTETVLYDPFSSTAVLLDDLPGRPERDEQGNLLPAPFEKQAMAMLGPTLVLVVWQIGTWATAG